MKHEGLENKGNDRHLKKPLIVPQIHCDRKLKDKGTRLKVRLRDSRKSGEEN